MGQLILETEPPKESNNTMVTFKNTEKYFKLCIENKYRHFTFLLDDESFYYCIYDLLCVSLPFLLGGVLYILGQTGFDSESD